MPVVKNPKDNQEVFDYVVNALRLQNERSIREGSCVYRGPDGLKCAAGHLIPDEDYKSCFEGRSVMMLSNAEVAIYFKNNQFDINLVCDLQEIHDSYEVCNWERRFKELAETSGSRYTPLNG